MGDNYNDDNFLLMINLSLALDSRIFIVPKAICIFSLHNHFEIFRIFSSFVPRASISVMHADESLKYITKNKKQKTS